MAGRRPLAGQERRPRIAKSPAELHRGTGACAHTAYKNSAPSALAGSAPITPIGGASFCDRMGYRPSSLRQ